MAETENQPWSIQRLLAWTTDFFQQRGLDSPRVAAEVLLAESLECPRIQLYARFAEIPQEPALGRFRGWVKRHAVGEPVAYLVGQREFYSLKFGVSPEVLIPRPETEHLVMLAIDLLRNVPADEKRVIDVGTGSGCIAVTLAKQVPALKVLAVDISPAALEVARANAQRHGVEEKVEFIQSDLLNELADDLKVPMIVSNPPYVGRAEVGTLDENVKKYEPELALYGGEQGLELTLRLVDQAVGHLLPQGWLLIETSPMLASTLSDAMVATKSFGSVEIKKDFAKQDRVIVARKI